LPKISESSAPLISVEGVWKKFRRGERHDSLRDLVPSLAKRWLKGAPDPTAIAGEEFWAVQDMSFEVRAGEAVGVIGPNGAGKSTLLKLLTRILKPNRGRCHVRGRVGALIEVAAGFHPDLTGRENVFLQGAIMGMGRDETARKFDEIVAFSGVSDFIDTPVKRYSSGMSARLGFAIAAHLDPDVLLIDEVLSVGDAGFQDQCVTRMREMLAQGVPLVFVSHNLPAVLELCTRAIVVDHGSVKYDGDPATALGEYRRAPKQQARSRAYADSPIHLGAVQLIDEADDEATVFRTGGTLAVRIPYTVRGRLAGAHFAVDVHRADGLYCAGINTRMDKRTFGPLEGSGMVELLLEHLTLLPGSYVVSVGILDASGAHTLDLQPRAYPFNIASSSRDLGVVQLTRAWRHVPNAVLPAYSKEECPS
jgi:lipopolysaccharide transport system ATP-binding protein